jgi:hypothetical protein
MNGTFQKGTSSERVQMGRGRVGVPVEWTEEDMVEAV